MSAPYEDVWKYAGFERQPGEGPLSSTNPAIQALIDNGTIWREDRTYSNEGGSGEYIADHVKWDSKNLPQMGPPGVGNKLGNWMPVGSGDPSKLLNPKLVYNDPNYGMITPSFNDPANKSNAYDMIGPIFSAALTGGLGIAALGPGAAALTQIPNAARSLASGAGAGGILGMLGGLAGGALGVPGGSALGKLAGSMAGSALSPKASSSAPSAPKMTPQQMFSSLSPQQKAMILMQYAPKPGSAPAKGK